MAKTNACWVKGLNAKVSMLKKMNALCVPASHKSLVYEIAHCPQTEEEKKNF